MIKILEAGCKILLLITEFKINSLIIFINTYNIKWQKTT